VAHQFVLPVVHGPAPLVVSYLWRTGAPVVYFLEKKSTPPAVFWPIGPDVIREENMVGLIF
jgi:hypothetical protein